MISCHSILVLEDHPLQRALISEVLMKSGFPLVDTAGSGQEALQMLKSVNYDILLIDLDMPDMDGMQFIRELAKQQRRFHLAISSACVPRMMDSAAQMARNLKLNVIGCFAKPLASTHIRQMLLHMQNQPYLSSQTMSATSILPPFSASQLVSALSNNEIEPWYQPKCSLKNGRIIGVEALARWQHPTAGAIEPSAFLPAITASALEADLLFHILKHALNAYKHWLNKGFRVPISINLPTHLLDDPTLPDQLQAKVEELDVAPDQVTFELLESSRTLDPALFFMGAARLRLKNFGLSQDDFGIGFSSMRNLTTVPFTELKIDRAFIAGVSTIETLAAATMTTISLGKKLGMKVTAEGVESQMDLAFLSRAGCDAVQGYLVSRPVPETEISAMLEAGFRLPMHHA